MARAREEAVHRVKPYYDDGTCVIYHGDALEVLPTLTAASATAVVTDPPYIIGALSSMGAKSGGWGDMMNSALWFTAWYRLVDHVLKRRGSFWTFLNWRSVPVVLRAAQDAGLLVTSMLVWDKEWIGPGGHQGLRPSYELVALLAGRDFAIPDRSLPDIWRWQVGSYKPFGHPAEKPAGLVTRILVSAAIPKGETVVDPFLGSGTTAVAAKALGLRCIGIEAEERYCEMAARRLGQEVLDFGAGELARMRPIEDVAGL